MSIMDKEIKEDFLRFIRHEAMRINTSQDKVFHVINKMISDNGKTDSIGL